MDPAELDQLDWTLASAAPCPEVLHHSVVCEDPVAFSAVPAISHENLVTALEKLVDDLADAHLRLLTFPTMLQMLPQVFDDGLRISPRCLLSMLCLRICLQAQMFPPACNITPQRLRPSFRVLRVTSVRRFWRILEASRSSHIARSVSPFTGGDGHRPSKKKTKK